MSSSDEIYSPPSTFCPTSRPTSRGGVTHRRISVDQSASAALGGGGGGGHFPHKLYDMLEYVSDSEQTAAISWTPDGTAFLIHDSEMFMQDIVPKFFRQTKFRSFTRQLNLWGFSRATIPQVDGWTHTHFVRGFIDGLKNVIRIEVKGTSSKGKSKSRKTKRSGRTASTPSRSAQVMEQPADKPNYHPGESRITKEHAKESDPDPVSSKCSNSSIPSVEATRSNNNLPMTQLGRQTTQQWMHHIAARIPPYHQPLVILPGPDELQGNRSVPSTVTSNFCQPQPPPDVNVRSNIAQRAIQPIQINQPVAATRAPSCSEPSLSDLTYLATLFEEPEEDEFDRAIRQMFCA